jgi:hypothetical protein
MVSQFVIRRTMASAHGFGDGSVFRHSPPPTVAGDGAGDNAAGKGGLGGVRGAWRDRRPAGVARPTRPA